MSGLHLTQIRIPYLLAAKIHIRDSYDWHQKLWQAFPDRDGQARDFLTRVDRLDDGCFRALILSPTAPVRPQWCPQAAWQSKEIPTNFLDKPLYRFSLVGNPTRKVNKKRIPIVSREGLAEWLQRKGEQHGFTCDMEAVRTVPRPRQYFNRHGSMGLHSAMEFSGVLQVTNHERFREAFTSALGRARRLVLGCWHCPSLIFLVSICVNT
jgi:CRISPR system Cascade subunit CasE